MVQLKLGGRRGLCFTDFHASLVVRRHGEGDRGWGGAGGCDTGGSAHILAPGVRSNETACVKARYKGTRGIRNQRRNERCKRNERELNLIAGGGGIYFFIFCATLRLVNRIRVQSFDGQGAFSMREKTSCI